MATSTQINALTALYVGYFDRAPDPAGLQFWIDQIDGGREFNTIAADFAASPEAKALYPYLTTPDVSTSSTFVQNIYLNLFGRTAEPEGLEFWTGVLEAGSVTVADFIEAIINGAVDAPTATPPTFDKAVLDNKIEVGLDFATDAGNTPGFEFDVASKSAAVASVNGVTEDEATVVAAKAATDAYLAGEANQGDTLTLTTGVDLINGTAANDTVSGAVIDTSGTSSTLSPFDTVDLGAGTDTLNVTVVGTAAAGTGFNGAAISNTENFFVRDLNTGGASTYDFAAISGEAQVWNDRSTQAVTFSNLGTGTTVGVKGDGATTVGATTFKMATATDAVSIAINGGVKGGNAITNAAGSTATGATIASTGAANTVGAITLSAGATVAASTVNAASDLTTGNITGHKADATMTVTGAGKASLGTLEAAVDTVDASANTGGLTLALDAEGDTKVTGGAGADSITTGAVLTTGSVDAGAGSDTLVVSNSAHISATVGGKYTNFETLQVNNGVSVDLDDLTGITAVKINDGAGNTGVTDLSAAQAGAVTVVAATAGGITIGVKGASTVGQIDTVKLTADDGVATTSTIALGNPTLTGVEKLELTAVDNVTVTALTNAEALNSITLNGAGTQSITSGDIDVDINTVVDGSAATGALTLDFGGVANAVADDENAMRITGGSKGDTITTSGAANDIVNGKGGIDTIDVTDDGVNVTNFATVQSEAIASVDADLVSGFVSTQNKFDFDGMLSNGTGAGNGIAAAEVSSGASISAALGTAGAANDIVFIATTDLTGNQETALDAAVAGGMTAAEADAVEAAFVGAGGALNGTIANLDSVLGAGDSALFQFSTDTDTVVFRVTNTDTSTADTLTVDEVELVGVFSGTTDLVAADYM